MGVGLSALVAQVGRGISWTYFHNHNQTRILAHRDSFKGIFPREGGRTAVLNSLECPGLFDQQG